MPAVSGRLIPPRLTGAPATPTTGELYYNTGDSTLYWWSGSAWVPAKGGAPAAVVGCRAYRTTTQNIANNTSEVVGWNTAGVDYSYPSTFADNPNNRLVIPYTGLYTITCYLRYESGISSTGRRDLSIVRGGTGTPVTVGTGTEIRLERIWPATTNTAQVILATVTRRFTAGDPIHIETLQSSGASATLNNGIDSTCLEAVYHGALGP